MCLYQAKGSRGKSPMLLFVRSFFWGITKPERNERDGFWKLVWVVEVVMVVGPSCLRFGLPPLLTIM